METLEFKSIFRALRSKNYRLFFTGQSISLIGTWMQQMAISWLVYRMTGSVFLLGLVAFIGQIPTFLVSPFAGVIADRHHRHQLLFITQGLAMLQAVVLTVLVLTNTITVQEIIFLSFLSGIINAFDIPVRQSFIIELIENKEDLSKAIALNSSMVNVAKLLGPSVAGFVIAFVGEGMCFLLNALSYVAVIFSLMVMKVPRREISAMNEPVWEELKDGFRYAFNSIPIRSILLLLALVSLMGGSYQVLMPIFAKDIFYGGPTTLGFLMAFSGLGALMGAMYLASRKSVVGLGKIMVSTTILFGLSVIGFALSRTLFLSLILILLAGFGMMVQMAASNMVLQTVVEDDKRGRIMSLYTMAFMGTAPFGGLLMGSLAHHLGPTPALLFGGISCILGALLFRKQLPIYRQHIWPIYIAKGIVPETA